jgi:hypothetical protein
MIKANIAKLHSIPWENILSQVKMRTCKGVPTWEMNMMIDAQKGRILDVAYRVKLIKKDMEVLPVWIKQKSATYQIQALDDGKFLPESIRKIVLDSIAGYNKETANSSH